MYKFWGKSNDGYGIIFVAGFIGLLTGHNYGNRLEHTLLGIFIGLVIGLWFYWAFGRFKWFRIISLGLFISFIAFDFFKLLFPINKPYLSIVATIIIAMISMIMFYSQERTRVDKQE